MSLHYWYLQTSCDLFRVCLPGLARESASFHLLESVSQQFVRQWSRLAVSHAVCMARTWQRIMSMKQAGAISLPGGLVPLSLAGCVSIHQCTKILLIAKEHQLYSDLTDPLSLIGIQLDAEVVDELCQSNIAYLDGLASLAPLAAIVQRDVKNMVSAGSQDSEPERDAPVTSDVQRQKVLSRYHPLAMSIDTSNEDGLPSIAIHREASSSIQGRLRTVPVASTEAPTPNPSREAVAFETLSAADLTALQSQMSEQGPESSNHHETQQEREIWMNNEQNDNTSFAPEPWQDLTDLVSAGVYSDPFTDYYVAASQSDMAGELNQFLMDTLMQTN